MVYIFQHLHLILLRYYFFYERFSPDVFVLHLDLFCYNAFLRLQNISMLRQIEIGFFFLPLTIGPFALTKWIIVALFSLLLIPKRFIRTLLELVVRYDAGFMHWIVFIRKSDLAFPWDVSIPNPFNPRRCISVRPVGSKRSLESFETLRKQVKQRLVEFYSVLVFPKVNHLFCMLDCVGHWP